MTTRHPTASLGGGVRSAKATLSSGLRTWLRHAAHVCYVFTPLSVKWKNRLAAAVYRGTGWIFKGDRNYEIWRRENNGRRISIQAS